MREEEIDWCIYRLIADGDAKTLSGINASTRFEVSVIESSLQRLTRRGLIGQTTNELYVSPMQEMIAQCQIRQDENSLITIENGVIKVKNQENRK